MEALVRDIVEQLKKTIAFLDKLKIDKKQKPDRDAIVNELNVTLRRCQTSIRGDAPDGDTYDDVGPTNGKSTSDDVYDDVGDNYDDVESTLPRPPPADDIYDDTGDDGMTYDDVSSAPLSAKEIPLVECESLKNPTIADFMELKRDKSLIKSPWQKRWCVLHLGILYMFENAKDKRQKEAFRINGCKFKLREDITKETKRKDRCFELRLNEKIYQFCANDKESLQKWRFAFVGKASSSLSNSLSGSIEDNYDDVSVERGPSKKKGFAIPLIGRKRPSKSPTKSAGVATDDGDLYEESYDDIGNRTYDDTGNQTYDDTGSRTYDDTGSRTYDDTGAQTYDDTGSYPAPPEEADDLYEETAAPPTRDHLPLPPPPTGLPQRRTSTKDELPPIPGSPKPHGFPLSPPTLPSREETGSASGTYRRNRPPMPLPGDTATNKRDLPPQPGQEPPRTSSPATVHQPPVPPPVNNEFPGDGDQLDTFGEDKEDYVNMYQGMWDCEPNESNELRFKRGEVIHILSKEYDDYGWWTAESCHQEIGLVPIGYLMKAYDI